MAHINGYKITYINGYKITYINGYKITYINGYKITHTLAKKIIKKKTFFFVYYTFEYKIYFYIQIIYFLHLI
jgi:hypothetical protein